MQSLQPNELLSFNENQLENVRKKYNYDVHRLKQDIDLFADWIAKQNHFRVRKFDRNYLERYLIYNKGSIERAKRHFDNMCTYRNLMPEFLQNFDIRNEFGPVRASCKVVIMPKPTPMNYRLAVLSMYSNHDNFDITMFYKYGVVVAEYIMHHDYCFGWEVVFDTRDMPISMLTKLNPVVIGKAFSLIFETMGQRLNGYHILSASSFFETIVSIFKRGLSQKLAARIKVHDNVESLHAFLDKDNLPLEYGGNGKSMQELDDACFKELSSDEHIARMKYLESATTDESCRLSSKFNEEYAGTAGSFKTMVLD